jgi:hypothetical protein
VIALALETNGVIINALAVADFQINSGKGFSAVKAYLSPEGNALSLLAHELKLLKTLDSLIGGTDGDLRRDAALPVFMALICRHTQLLDHSCYRLLVGGKRPSHVFAVLTT